MPASRHSITVSVLEYQSTASCESGTSTTTVTITDHGLNTGDFIVNTSQRATSQLLAERGSRKITKTDANTFTVTPAITDMAEDDVLMLFSFTDRTSFVKDGSFSLSKRAQGDYKASFQMIVDKS